ncbi:hypothetical protein OsI_38713 [Oryza sativa Indica Group]|uniref:Uncharacterized protein n=2 Tax=Oryza sativa TaxID=4530 RepID=B9GDR4_ORYSJ|nr:hypothetical protein OsI_38713 [Oryza sativa Indica Group]EEE53421.1 hypothetical protein OsJ_36496 [Oryza sativa Japonica Group]
MPPQIASSVRLRASFIHRCRSGALFRWCWWGYSVSAASAVTASALLASPVPRFQNPNLQAPAAHYTSTPLTSCHTLPAACNGTTSPVLSAPPGGRTSLPCATISSPQALSRKETWTPYLLAVATNSSIGNSTRHICLRRFACKASVKLTDPRKYFVQHAYRILLHGARAMSKPMMIEEAIFTLVKDLATDLQNSPYEIIGYSGVKQRRGYSQPFGNRLGHPVFYFTLLRDELVGTKGLFGTAPATPLLELELS